jgi:hypothetical protein
MAKYKALPILRDSRLMMVEVERIVKDFPRYHKYTLGTEIRQTAMKSKCVSSYQQRQYISQTYLLNTNRQSF